MTRSVDFDRAADYYDRTRALSPEALRATVAQLASELSGRDPVLEVGIGTGLIGVPLSEAGARVVGVDISEPMLRKVVEKGRRSRLPVVAGDATHLPFPDGTFGGALLRHVLHLIPEWRRAAAEMVRIVRPGGILLLHQGGYPRSWWSLADRFIEAAGGGRFSVGLHPRDVDRLDRTLAAHGASVRALPPIPERVLSTVGAFIDQMEEGLHSWTWRFDQETRRRAAERTRAWAREKFGRLDVPPEETFDIVWRAYDLS